MSPAADDLIGITCFFNPNGYQRRVANYRSFRTHSRHQGLKLVCVEVAEDQPFSLREGDADILIQLRASTCMWWKERLLNIALEHIPKEFSKVVWLDCDVLMQDDDWLTKTSQALDRHKIVQPFSSVKHLDRLGKVKERRKSFGCMFHDWKLSGFMGCAWAAQLPALRKFGFYDRAILGSGDLIMIAGFTNSSMPRNQPKKLNRDARDWAERAYQEIQGDIGYVQNTAIHLWHGEEKNRLYSYRYEAIKQFDFDPMLDLKLDENGLWSWATDKPVLHRFVRDYFYLRSEDGEKRKLPFAGLLYFLRIKLRQYALRPLLQKYFEYAVYDAQDNPRRTANR